MKTRRMDPPHFFTGEPTLRKTFTITELIDLVEKEKQKPSKKKRTLNEIVFAVLKIYV